MFASDSVSSSVWTIRRVHAIDTPEQWADFLVVPNNLFTDNIKPREPRTHLPLLLKYRQMPTQAPTASRSYVLFRGAIKGHTKVTTSLPGCRHICRVLQTWKTRIIRYANIRLVRNAFEPNFHLHSKSPSIILLINAKACNMLITAGFFLCRNRYLCEDASRISPMIVSMEFVTLLCSMASI